MHRAVIVLLLVAFIAGAARANDSTAELTNGGLIFVHNNNVEMRSEDIYISAREVRVHHRFFNKSNTERTLLVAFPMPEIHVDQQDVNPAVPTGDPVNLLGFSTLVNGKPVATKVEQRAIAAGIDRTQYLRILGVPLAPHLRSTSQALDRLPKDRWEALVRMGLAEIVERDAGKGMQKHLSARWSLQTTFYWEQVFPAQEETVIEHHYQPSVGTTIGTNIGARSADQDSWLSKYERKYCIDQNFLNSVERIRRSVKDEQPQFQEQRIDYLLRYGGNWLGPIADFRLVVDKGDAGNLVSFCGEDVKKISPTQLEMRKTNYTPDGNLSVLILKRIAQ